MARSTVDEVERKIITLIEKAGDKGLIQRELWSILGLDSRSGARIISRLEKRGIVERERTIYKGKLTYLVKVAKRYREKKYVSPLLKEIPCFSCENLFRCGEGGEHDPAKCEKLSRWLEERALGNKEGS